MGERRVGLAISDPTATLARPLETLSIRDRDAGGSALDQVAAAISRLSAEDDGLSAIVIGMPRHLDGSASIETRRTEAFIAALRTRTELPIVTEDERLTSREAESRLSLRERDWRKRKAQLDAAAAAVILQDYLDRQHA
jgi:putative holliday junction resolvase